MLEQYRTQSFETTTVQGVSSTARDALLESQHPTLSSDDDVHMDADYVFDASLDDSIGGEAQQLCKALVRKFPQSMLFIFLP